MFDPLFRENHSKQNFFVPKSCCFERKAKLLILISCTVLFWKSLDSWLRQTRKLFLNLHEFHTGLIRSISLAKCTLISQISLILNTEKFYRMNDTEICLLKQVKGLIKSFALFSPGNQLIRLARPVHKNQWVFDEIFVISSLIIHSRTFTGRPVISRVLFLLIFSKFRSIIVWVREFLTNSYLEWCFENRVNSWFIYKVEDKWIGENDN